jgi:hypothetical protein
MKKRGKKTVILLKGKYAKKTKRESSSNTEASGEV